MKTRRIFLIISITQCVLAACFLFLHRNVIKALIKGEEVPELPKWHPHCCVLQKQDDSLIEEKADTETK